MKHLSAMLKHSLLLSLLLSVNLMTNADELVNPCSYFIKKLNKEKINNLYNNQANIHLSTTPDANDSNGKCTIQFTADTKTNEKDQDIGSVSIYYKQPDNLAFYEANKKQFINENSALDWSSTLPNVKEGFVITTNPYHQMFSAYLTNGDYVIFMYKGLNDTNTPSTSTKLDPSFAKFINVVSQQIISH